MKVRRPGSRPGPAAVCRDPDMEGVDVGESTIGHGWKGDVLLGPECERDRPSIESLLGQIAQWCKDPAPSVEVGVELAERWRCSRDPADEIRSEDYIEVLILLAQRCKDPANDGRLDHSAAGEVAVEIAELLLCSKGPADGIRREDYIESRGLECLTIVEESHVEPPTDGPGGKETGRYPFIWKKDLASGLGSGVPTDLPIALRGSWFQRRIREWKSRQPPGSLPRAVAVEIAPDEDAIKAFIKLAASSPDHWDALIWAATILWQRRQPLGEALSDWKSAVFEGKAKRPDGRRAAKAQAKLLRDAAIVGAVRAIERLGIPPTRHRDPCSVTGIRRRRNTAEYLSGCAIVAEVFGMQAMAVENVWRSRP